MRALVVGGEHLVLAHRQLAGGRVDIASWQAQHHAFYAEIAELGAAAGWQTVVSRVAEILDIALRRERGDAFADGALAAQATGERIRDKIAASKRKGMWMGGVPPLGYDVENRRLVPNEREAKLIRHIFQRFVELGSSTALVKELKLDGVTSKAWTTQDGKTREGRPIDKGHIYKLLSNRTYLGELRHKDQWYQAEHPPIISRELWDSVRAILETNGRVRGNTTRAKVPYLLKGIVFGNDGRALSPWHTTKKNGRRYRYYVPQRDAKEHAGASGLPRLPAAELESAVLDQLRAILRAPNLLGEMLPQAIKLDPTLDEAKITVAMTRLDAIWDQLFPAEQTRIVKLLVEKVIVSPNDLEVRLRANGIERLVLELRPEPVEQQEVARA
ncbi:MAG: recombinase family protein [Proteobacteria bacterium]|nr:recombinase family protein [Pseudomonadota bacterium]